MVEINNQRKDVPRMALAWSEGTDNGRQKTKSWLWRHCRRRAIYWLLRSPPQTCHAKPKLSPNRRRTRRKLLPAGGCLPQEAIRKILSESQDAVALQQIKERGAYLWLIVVISVRQSTVAAISGLHCRALVISSEHNIDVPDCNQRAGTVREIDVWAESPRLSPLWLSASSARSSWAVNHYRDNAITYKAQRDKNARELKLANAATRHADASAWCCCARCKIHVKELADAKAENDALRDDVAAGRRRLHIKAVCQSVREATTASGVDNAAPRSADTAERDYFTLRERLTIMQKQLEGTQKYINDSR